MNGTLACHKLIVSSPMTPGLGVKVIDEASDKERMFEG
jgi:Na+-translocating ferredoxin:NAD+ oxidoreductase RnfG subunit